MKLRKISYKGVAILFSAWLALVYVICMTFGVLIEPAWVPLWKLVLPAYMGLPGFDLTAIGLIAGFIWSALYGALGGLAFSFVYNTIVARFVPIELSE
ncbi:MAG: hypothetical protein M8353_02030 [ANME-2 cluster archaeon]|nr:hypothetical protein [ANME-2 cluster archaeon]